ncbi:carboxypeptidase regulatory-like domain-containing protein [filamentous cyanobacterium CCP5]|nr:carboxypeptidase regulatory-like domain-containing protein [filamentous cyanobacterium CCP5]
MKPSTLTSIIGGFGLALSATAALAHGANIEVSQGQIQIQATYDGGNPMANAQVLVYSPDNLEEPWTEATTDESGRFSFEPDSAGTWEVTVRQAGHGDVVTIPVGESATAADSPEVEAAPVQAGLSPMQQWVTIGSVIWGFVGTALFFSRGKR